MNVHVNPKTSAMEMFKDLMKPIQAKSGYCKISKRLAKMLQLSHTMRYFAVERKFRTFAYLTIFTIQYANNKIIIKAYSIVQTCNNFPEVVSLTIWEL